MCEPVAEDDRHFLGKRREAASNSLTDGDIRDFWADISAAREVLGYEPPGRPRRGMELTAEASLRGLKTRQDLRRIAGLTWRRRCMCPISPEGFEKAGGSRRARGGSLARGEDDAFVAERARRAGIGTRRVGVRSRRYGISRRRSGWREKGGD